MIDVQPHDQGAILPVRARPGARRDAILDEHAGALRVAVAAPPDRGRANEAIIDVLADALGLKRNQIELLTGATARQKRFLIHDLSTSELLERLRAHLLAASDQSQA